MEIGFLALLPLMTIATLAIYWTLFKIRKDLNETQGKIISALLELQKLLGKK